MTHKITGLTWKRCFEGQTWDGKTCTGEATFYTYDQAVKLTSTFGGKSDWRLPNIVELQTLVEREKYMPTINTAMFPNMPAPSISSLSSTFWSSSPDAYLSNSAWSVGFDNGSVSSVLRSYSCAVRLVRGGQPLTSLAEYTATSTFTDLGNGTVLHKTTNLIWKRCAEGQTWDGKTCTGTATYYIGTKAVQLTSNFGGNSDWRVPTTNELVTLVDYSIPYPGPTINQGIFPNTTGDFWSSSHTVVPNVGGHPDAQWYVFFLVGQVFDADSTRSPARAVRLVRGKQSWFSSSTPATDPMSCVFNWLESKYPQYYAPANKNLLTWQGNSYRYYATTDSLLVYSPKDDILWSGYGTTAGYQYIYLGLLKDWKSGTGCK